MRIRTRFDGWLQGQSHSVPKRNKKPDSAKPKSSSSDKGKKKMTVVRPSTVVFRSDVDVTIEAIVYCECFSYAIIFNGYVLVNLEANTSSLNTRR